MFCAIERVDVILRTKKLSSKLHCGEGTIIPINQCRRREENLRKKGQHRGDTAPACVCFRCRQPKLF